MARMVFGNWALESGPKMDVVHAQADDREHTVCGRRLTYRLARAPFNAPHLVTCKQCLAKMARLR
jgi:hypothetical protein